MFRGMTGPVVVLIMNALDAACGLVLGGGHNGLITDAWSSLTTISSAGINDALLSFLPISDADDADADAGANDLFFVGPPPGDLVSRAPCCDPLPFPTLRRSFSPCFSTQMTDLLFRRLRGTTAGA
jgi:hypothetical protein